IWSGDVTQRKLVTVAWSKVCTSFNSFHCGLDAYSYHFPVGQNIGWAKLIWNQHIPPSKSLLLWRCLHDKLPTDDTLALRGCNLPSMNQCRFANKSISFRSALNLIVANVSLSGNNSKMLPARSSIEEFVILKNFHFQIQSTITIVIKEVIWQPPIFNWIKCNCDGAAANGNPGPSACGGIFRD
ncbi:GDSL esterase/lipase, partial [Trifolium pratense]